MNSTQKIFLLLIILGGISVLLSYIFGLKGGKNTDALWGGVPVNVRGVYTLSMVVSAISFLIFTSFIFLNLETSSYVLQHFCNSWSIPLLYLTLLIPSALWIPLVNQMVSEPSALIWIGIRIVLILVALASILLLLHVLTLSPRPMGIFYYSSIIGLSWFIIHTGVLDALVWPYLWSRK